MPEDEQELTIADAAKVLGVSHQRVRELVELERLRGRLVAGKIRVFTRAELAVYEAERAQRPRGGRPAKTEDQ